MMSTGRDVFLEELRDFVRSVPTSLVRPLAKAIEMADVANWAYARNVILQSIRSPEARTKTDGLLRAWRTHAQDISPQSVSLALLAAAETEAGRQQRESVELVWTGPDGRMIPLRRTDQALLQVIHTAKENLLIVSFAVYRIPEITQALVQAAERGVDIMICVESPEPGEGLIAYDAMQSLGQEVTRHARVYRWPQEQRPVSASGRCGSLHAKCAVADDDLLFISSANLTEYAMTLNMELGVLIRGGPLPGKVVRHFERLVEESFLIAIRSDW